MPHCLHLWSPHDQELPKPPSQMVGVGEKPVRTDADAFAIRDEAMRKLLIETRNG